MRRTLTFLSPLVLVLAVACETKPADSTESTDAPAMSADSDERPDAQTPSGGNGNVPDGWSFNGDRGTATVTADSTGDVFFVNMTPGWHVTTGPAGIFHHPSSTATGEYRASADIHLFDPGSRREGFGLIIGGDGLGTPDQEYSYFLIRQGGQYLIKNREGTETTTLVAWTDNESINSYPGADGGTALNKLEVQVAGDSVEFYANGTLLTTLPKSDVRTDGVVGLRVNHGLNLHVSDLTVDATY